MQTRFKWLNRFIIFHNNQPPSVVFDQHVEQYLSCLVNHKKWLVSVNGRREYRWLIAIDANDANDQ
ncbi:phage integrase N-terminal SAM-like domain-containing protein [Brumicola pallidula]|uniref:Integrase SAM-like N-terminal domain-containing protein n=1 Tax=Brumicola pallidula DSM 14239 = ACAM 615 TaxID=1121922 RepID=K6ZMQ3_9ALTE|nr:hypothetical protein GPAL_3320 [Glaciecola pallidula DSM 14239 = ACAM 615]